MSKKRLFAGVAVLAMLIMSYAAMPVLGTQAQADDIIFAPACCKYGYQCRGDLECCEPDDGMADCSPSKPNYCRKSC